jgi:hypothetical protein
MLKNKNSQFQNSDNIPTFIPKSMRNKINNEMNEEQFPFKNSSNPNSKFSNEFRHENNKYNPNIYGISCGNNYSNTKDSFQEYFYPLNQFSKSKNSNTSQNINNFNYYNAYINNYFGSGSCCNHNNNNYSSDFFNNNNNNSNYNDYNYINSLVNMPENSYQKKFPQERNLCANCHSSITGGQSFLSNNISFRNYDNCNSKNSNTPYQNNLPNNEKNSMNYVINDAIKSILNNKYTEDITSLSTKSQSENYFAYKFSNYGDESLRLDFNRHIEYIQEGPIKLFDGDEEDRRKYEYCRDYNDNDEIIEKQEMSKNFYGPQKSKNICNTYFRSRIL